jgi:hypothetical protein
MSTLFNGVLDDNREDVENFARRVTSPFRRLWDGFGRAQQPVGGAQRVLEVVAGPVLILGLTGLIYSFNDSDWGLNKKSLVLFLSVAIAAGLATLIYEGGEALVHRRRHRVEAGIRLFPTAIALAVGFVVLSRLVDFEAPIMYGFIAGAAILVPATLDHRQTGFAIFIPATILLLLSLAAWGLVAPLRDASNNNGNWWAVLPGESAAILFVSGIEGLLFAMIPVKFLDGLKIFRWNRVAWLPLFGIPAFLFAWVILNPEAKAFDALLEGRVITALSLAAVYSIIAVGLWAFFFVRRAQAAGAALAAS